MNERLKVDDIITMPYQPSFLEKIMVWLRLKSKKENQKWIITEVFIGGYGRIEEKE